MINQPRYLEWIKCRKKLENPLGTLRLVLSEFVSGKHTGLYENAVTPIPMIIGFPNNIHLHHSTSIYWENTNVAKILEIFFLEGNTSF